MYKWAEGITGGISANNNRVEKEIESPEECQELCEEEERFECRSIEFNDKEKECHLQTATKESLPHLWITWFKDWTYYEYGTTLGEYIVVVFV